MEQFSDTEKTVEQGRPPQVSTEANAQMPSTSAAGRVMNCQRRPQERPLSERERYYRHKRRYNRRLERRFDALLNVFGQIVKAEYPNINVSPLIGAATQGITLANNLFKSENENDSADEENESSSDTERMPFNKVVGSEASEGVGNEGQQER